MPIDCASALSLLGILETTKADCIGTIGNMFAVCTSMYGSVTCVTLLWV